jgi:Ca-activated chloride channel homolog
MTPCVSLTFCVALIASTATPRELIQEGNRLVAEGKLSEAEKKYNEAAVGATDVSHIEYNRGVVYYKRADYKKATEHFQKMLGTKDRPLEIQALYNLGNCHFQEAVKLQQDLPEAIKRLRSAAQSYRDCLEAQPTHAHARTNLDLAKRFLKRLIDEKKKRDEEQKKKKSPQSQPNRPKQQEKKEKKKNQQQQQQQKKNQQQQQQKQQQQKQQKRISREEAERMLRRAMARQMKKRQQRQKPKQQMQGGGQGVDRDW